MSALVEKHSAAVRQAESKLASAGKALEDGLKSEAFRTALDAAGLVDPTPVSDAVGAAASIAAGDWVGAGLSIVSMVPYAGDALGKSVKGARMLKRVERLEQVVAGRIKALREARLLARGDLVAKKAATAEVRAQRAAQAARETAQAATCRTCKAPSNPFGVSRLPDADGDWVGTRGDSLWKPDPATPRGKLVERATGGQPVQFNDGYPDFTPFVYKHNGRAASVEIPDMKGNTTSDFTAANNAMKHVDPDWSKPKGWTWHHKEDGVTMELVPFDLNDKVAHEGGAAIARLVSNDPVAY